MESRTFGTAATVGRPSHRLRRGTWLVGATCPHFTATMALGPTVPPLSWEVMEQVILAEIWRACPSCPALAELYVGALQDRRN